MSLKLNPFNPNSTVSTNLFAGRSQQTLHVIRKLEQVKNGMPSSFFLSGVRGIGKTALAKLINYIAKVKDEKLGNLNFLTSYYSVESGQKINSALQFSLNELTEQLPKSAIDILSSGLGRLFKNGKFTIGVFSAEIGMKEQDEMVALKDQMVSILSKLIDAIKADTGDEKKDGILIIIDELHNVADLEFCAQLFRGITTTLDVKEKGFISFLLIGYQETLEIFFKGDASARRLFDIVELEVMPKNEAKEVLTKGFQQLNVTYDEKLLEQNIMITSGYPHSIQMIGHNLVEVDVNNHIGKDDWEEAKKRTAEQLQTKDFADMYNFRGKRTNKEYIMDILAVSSRPLKLKEIQDFCGGKNIYQYVKPLKTTHSIFVNPKDDTIELHSHLFKTAIMLHIIPRIIKEKYLIEVISSLNSKD